MMEQLLFKQLILIFFLDIEPLNSDYSNFHLRILTSML